MSICNYKVFAAIVITFGIVVGIDTHSHRKEIRELKEAQAKQLDSMAGESALKCEKLEDKIFKLEIIKDTVLLY